MTTWGVGAIPLNVQTKLERDEDLTLVIRAIQTKYAKALRGVWMERNYKSTSNKIVWCKEVGFLTQYHDLEMIHGR
jgi:hypothetical protein